MDDSQQSRKRQRTSADGARVETGAERQAGATSSAAFAAAAGSSGSKPKYLASSPSGGAVEEPRVGTNYQATRLPESNTFAPPKGAAAAAAASTSGGRPVSSLPALSPVEGTCVWQGHRMRAADAIKLDAYLRSVEMLFYASSEHYDEEKALEVLHRCNYDTVQALELLQPWARVEEDDDNARDGTGEKKEFESDDACAVCGDGGDLIICDAKGCKRVYHAVCAELAEIPSGQWECAVHFCHTCGQRVNDANSVRCSSCPTSFCAAHIPACQYSARNMNAKLPPSVDRMQTADFLLWIGSSFSRCSLGSSNQARRLQVSSLSVLHNWPFRARVLVASDSDVSRANVSLPHRRGQSRQQHQRSSRLPHPADGGPQQDRSSDDWSSGGVSFGADQPEGAVPRDHRAWRTGGGADHDSVEGNSAFVLPPDRTIEAIAAGDTEVRTSKTRSTRRNGAHLLRTTVPRS
jgi:hypothetical protein